MALFFIILVEFILEHAVCTLYCTYANTELKFDIFCTFLYRLDMTIGLFSSYGLWSLGLSPYQLLWCSKWNGLILISTAKSVHETILVIASLNTVSSFLPDLCENHFFVILFIAL